MKLSTTIMSACLFTLFSATANAACPKGTVLQGGNGPNHHGGKCVAVAAKKAPHTAHAHVEAKQPAAHSKHQHS